MIQIFFNTQSIVPSCSVADVDIYSDSATVVFQLLAGGLKLFQERYFTYNGHVRVSDIAHVIEQYLTDDPENALAKFRIVATDEDDNEAEAEFTALYCASSLETVDFGQWLRENFLTLCPMQRIAPSGEFRLAWYAAEGEALRMSLLTTYSREDGTRGTFCYDIPGGSDIAQAATLAYKDVSIRSVEQTVKAYCEDAVRLLSVTAKCGDRCATFFIDQSLSQAQTFLFMNNFCQPEIASFHATTTVKVQSERNVASLGGVSAVYDISTKKVYEVETAPLNADECILMEQLLTSKCVQVPIAETEGSSPLNARLATVLITDFTYEIAETGSELNSVKFTWRYADNDTKLPMRQGQHIFSDTFQPQFS